MQPGRAAVEQLAAEPGGVLDADAADLVRAVGDRVQALGERDGTCVPDISAIRSTWRTLVIGMTPGTTGATAPRERISSANAK